MKLNWGAWLLGLLAAVIGGGANGIVMGLTSIGVDPEHFNLGSGLKHTLYIAGAAFVISGILSMAFYLKQSPVPQPREEWSGEQREAMRQAGKI